MATDTGYALDVKPCIALVVAPDGLVARPNRWVMGGVNWPGKRFVSFVRSRI